MLGTHFAEHGLAAPTGQMHIEQHHPREPFADELDRRLHVVRLPHHLDRIAQLRADPGAEHGVIVHQEDPGSSPVGHPILLMARSATSSARPTEGNRELDLGPVPR